MVKSLLSLVTLSLLLATTSTAQQLPQSFIYGGCSPLPPFPAFSASLKSLLSAITNSSTTSLYNNFTQNGVVQGLYHCRGDLPLNPDCSSCVSNAISQLIATCPSSSGAVVQLQGCYVKYDATPFLGVEDDSIVFKKFGPSVGLEREKTVGPDRDSVLTRLVDGSGEDDGAPYRAVGSGSVRGMVQCLGDLSVDQCRDCVDQAVQVMRNECGSAVYGDVFLAKCYARFSITGSVATGYGGKIRIGSLKTFAIIVGLLAATVILVLFFTFLCRAFGEGKHSGTGGK